MLNRRTILAAMPLAQLLAATPAAAETFEGFVAGVKAEARRHGIRQTTLDRAFAGVRVNRKVIELDRHQPEFTLTWEQYRSRIVSAARIARGRALYARHRTLLGEITQRYGVPPGPIMGIWGLESNFGESSGGYNVIEALATLSWDGRRAAFFRSELMDALRILDHGDIPPSRMVGSYAGAMGQPQFMPDSFLKFAVDFAGTGRRDIWGNTADVFASVANYLAKSGWSDRLPWGAPARLPQGFDPSLAGRTKGRTIADWARLGVVPEGASLPPASRAAVILPGGAQGEAFLACDPNVLAIRRYNPSDFYCISVGLIGDGITA
ncbi:MAG: lytic murein transglycosylase [Rhodospirillales bacterium]|nr:lytic murein transglycosylase [Rhodospirillales bacterium]